MTKSLKLDLEAHKLLESQRQSLDETQLSILKRVLRNAERASTPNRRPTPVRPTRETGRYRVQLGARQIITGSQKAAYMQLLTWLDDAYPGLFERLALTPGKRGRRIVARSAAALYPKADLQVYAEPIKEGWFADLNLSREQKVQRLRQACAETGLTYGVDADAGL